jgi:hypothetical protein
MGHEDTNPLSLTMLTMLLRLLMQEELRSSPPLEWALAAAGSAAGQLAVVLTQPRSLTILPKPVCPWNYLVARFGLFDAHGPLLQHAGTSSVNMLCQLSGNANMLAFLSDPSAPLEIEQTLTTCLL